MSNNTIKAYDGTEIYETDIQLYLDQYITDHEIEDMHREPQSRWNAALLYINKYLFKPNRDILKADNYMTGNLKYNNSSNQNAYDADKVNRVCDIYINLCYEYDKEISILGFSKLTGINPDTFYDWGSESSRPGSSCCEIYKKLSQEREESLSNKLVTGKQNPVGLLGVLNRHYGWNMGQPRGQQEQKVKSLEQLEQHYGIDQALDQPQLPPPEADF